MLAPYTKKKLKPHDLITLPPDPIDDDEAERPAAPRRALRRKPS